MNLFTLTGKNIKLLFRAKSSALIVFFAPLLIILIIGLSYNTSEQYSLDVGIYSSGISDDVNNLASLLEDEGFNIVRYDSSIEDCINDIKSGHVHTCLDVPESLAIEDNTPKQITFYIDPSNINLVYVVQQTLQEEFSFKAQEISEELSSNILSKLVESKDTISEQHGVLQTIKEKSSTASSSTQSAASGLESVDVSVAETSYNTSMFAGISSGITNGKTSINNAKGTIENSSLSASEKSDILESLTDAETDLDSALTTLSGESSLNALLNELTSMKNKLQSASTTIESSGSELSTAKSSLDEVLSSLNGVLTALDELHTLLASQKVTEAGIIATPLITKIETVSPESTYLNYLLPALLVLVVMFSSLILGTVLVMMEKNSPAYLRNFFVPIKKITFILATYLTTLILIIIEVIIILVASLFFLKDVISSFPEMALILFVAATVFTFIGMIIGYIFSSEETGLLASISVGSLLLFVSGLILPLEGMAPTLREIIGYSPFVIAQDLISNVLIFGSSLQSIWTDLVTLIGYAIVLFLIVLFVESIMHKHYVGRFISHRRHHRRKGRTIQKNVKE